METLTVFLEQHPKDEAAYSWFHWFMMGALLKYKNLQRRIMQKKISQTKFMTFMMGLHERAGAESKGTLIIRLKDYVFSRKKSKQILLVYLHNGCRPKIGSKTPVDIVDALLFLKMLRTTFLTVRNTPLTNIPKGFT